MKVYVVAGEPSGDLLASGLMRALIRAAGDVEFRGVGGESMAEVEGFESLFDISEISVMGFFEVLPRLPLILKRIRQTADDIERFAPDVLVTVDSWGFVSALLTRLRKRGSKIPAVHYVAPQVWAWKKGRARNVARLVSRLMTLLPDEGRYFEKYGLPCDFVGHPVVERMGGAVLDPEAFRAANGIPPAARVITLLPGSRRQEVKRLLPILKEAVHRITENDDGFFVVVPTVAAVERQVRAGFEGFDLPVRVVTGAENRYNAFAVSELALAKSGTVSLELVALGVPHLIVYTFGRISNKIAPWVIHVPFANLINLRAGREIIPEFVLDRCLGPLIAACAGRLLDRGSGSAERQVAEARHVLRQLRLPDILPSDRAARIVIEEVQNNKHKTQ